MGIGWSAADFEATKCHLVGKQRGAGDDIFDISCYLHVKIDNIVHNIIILVYDTIYEYIFPYIL